MKKSFIVTVLALIFVACVPGKGTPENSEEYTYYENGNVHEHVWGEFQREEYHENGNLKFLQMGQNLWTKHDSNRVIIMENYFDHIYYFDSTGARILDIE